MEKVKLYAEDAVIVDNKIYCIGSKISVLFSIDMENGKIKIVERLPNEKLFLNKSCRRIINWNRNLIFIPYGATEVHIFNIDNGEWNNIEFPDMIEGDSKYLEALLYNDEIIMIGADAKDILELNLKTYEMKKVNDYFEKFNNPKDLFCRSGHVVLNGYLYIAIAINNEILKINLLDWKYEVINVGEDGHGFSGIAYDGDYFWLTPRRDKDVLIWDGKEKVEKFKLPFELIKNKCNFGGVYYTNKKIFLHGFEGKYSAIIDKKTRTVDYNENQYVFLKKLYDNKIIGQLDDSQIMIYDEENVYYFSCEIEKRVLDDYYLKTNNVLNSDLECQNEFCIFDLNNFLRFI